MGKWRQFFEGADGDILSVIEGGILVAASDCPNELRKRRDMIAQKLFTCLSSAAAAELGSSAEEDLSGNAQKEDHSGNGKEKNAQEEDHSGNGKEKNHSENVEDQKQSVKQHGRPIIRIKFLNKVIKCFASTAPGPNAVSLGSSAKQDHSGNAQEEDHGTPNAVSLGSSAKQDHSGNAQEEDHSGNGEEKDMHSGNVENKDQSGNVEDPKQNIKHVGTDLQEWKLKSVNEKFLREKMESSKRRLQQGYQQAERAKRQRTVQVIELQDLPKQHGRPTCDMPKQHGRPTCHMPKQHGRPIFRKSGRRPIF
ncbi:probable mediator of RNA polymerase II transcription subunit 26a [Cryptomeria japonica]|uniref:probable mediator of RNA polymerase II transcription subunit 26a n=1 Tax=Cryptomeria japonica TaxID=3369 RepID=UPI0027DA7471|nr:probable mediator of RNA polymerase II transcription subunit 26a [Cryptomeria japonica]